MRGRLAARTAHARNPSHDRRGSAGEGQAGPRAAQHEPRWLVDPAALVAALKTGRIGAAGLDVYEEESEYFFRDRSDRAVQDDLLARLLTFPNELITSHQGFLTREALDNIAESTLASVAELLDGRRLTNAIGVT